MGYILTTKQANVIVRAWENGDIEADKSIIDKMRLYADNPELYWDKFGFNMNYHIREAIEYIIRKRFSRAQQHIEGFAYWAELKEEDDVRQAIFMEKVAELVAKKNACELA